MNSRLSLFPLLAIPLLLSVSSPARGENWPGWRGPQRNGVTSDQGAPGTWSSTSNVAWKAPLPGSGISNPIVWKSVSPTIAAMIGSITPAINASMIALNVRAITRPTAIVTMSPLLMKSLNSSSIFFMWFLLGTSTSERFSVLQQSSTRQERRRAPGQAGREETLRSRR